MWEKEQEIKNTEENTENKKDFVENEIIENKEEVIENKNEEVISQDEKEINNEEKQEEIQVNKNEDNKEKIIFDININSLQDLIKILVINKYDFFTIIPDEDKVAISFKKDNLEKELKYIKFPVYQKILLKAKSTAKLKIDDLEQEQENKVNITFNWKNYELLVKTKPDVNWERLFVKLKEIEKKVVKKKKQKMSISKMLSIFAGLLFVTITLIWVFMALVIFNSNSVSDLQFFNSLWVNANAIKEFAAKLINWIFWFILLIEVIFLFIFAYKAILTKKEFKQKRITRIIISIFFLILATVTFITWITLSKKIQTLKWLNYWKVEFYDNDRFLSSLFEKDDKKIDITKNIIWPVTIRFDNKEFIKKLIDDWFTPKKVYWKVWKSITEKPINDNYFIYKFDKKGIYPIQLMIEWINIKGEEDKKEKEIGQVNISNIVKVSEIKLKNWWKKFIFDARDLKDLW
jgi:CRISPR/Cas system-associated protein endoribonuclease Cas2